MQAHKLSISCQLRKRLTLALVEKTNAFEMSIGGIVAGQRSGALQRSSIKMGNCECAQTQHEPEPSVQLGH